MWAERGKFAQQIHIRQNKLKSNQNRIMMSDVIDEQANSHLSNSNKSAKAFRSNSYSNSMITIGKEQYISVKQYHVKMNDSTGSNNHLRSIDRFR